MTGKLYGFCVGINDYPGTGNDLSGCVNDAKDAEAMLCDMGADPTVLVNEQATRGNILDGLSAIVGGMRYGDTLVYWHSGHGTRVPDLDDDEQDGWDECLVPYDFAQGLIRDDELTDVFAKRPYGTRIEMIADTCHSGTVYRFAGPLTESQRRVKYLPMSVLPASTFEDKPEVMKRANALPATAPRVGLRKTGAVLMSGCMDHEYSYDAWFSGRPNGAFTYVALRAFQHGMTFRDWHAAIRRVLPSVDYPQTPMLSGTSHQKRWEALV